MKKVFIILSLILLVISCVFWFLSGNYAEYAYQRIVNANNPTILFSCNDFKSQAEIQKILIENNSEKIKEVNLYLIKINGMINVIEVGSRCPQKYQFEITFNGDEQRLQIERMLDNQKLEGVPVFLRNV